LNTHSIQWFLCLSLAVHAALLTTWQMPSFSPGNSAHTLLLSVTQRSGENSGETTVASSAQPATDDPYPPQQAEAPATEMTTASAAHPNETPPPLHKQAADQPRSAEPSGKITAAAAVAASNPVLHRQETDRHLRNSIMELITRKLTYPAIARRKGWQGIVKLELHIEADGSISNLQLDETSGYSVLDQAAIQCLQYASLPGAAHWLQGQTINIVVPVEYRLVDS